jgi:hypothetical protein
MDSYAVIYLRTIIAIVSLHTICLCWLVILFSWLIFLVYNCLLLPHGKAHDSDQEEVVLISGINNIIKD